MEQIKLDSFTGLIAFARTASLGSYTAASRSLGVSPSAVSKSVQRLEEYLGVKLFNRTTRSLSLTTEGHEILAKALQLMSTIEDIEQTVIASKHEPAGLLKIAAPSPIGTNILAKILPDFLDKYPNIKVDIRLGDQFTDLIEEGIDITIRVGTLADSRLVAKALAPHNVGAFASPDYLKRFGTPIHPNELSEHHCINFRFQSSGQALHWAFNGPDIEEFIPNSRIIMDASDSIISTVVSGGGIAISPHYVAAPYVARGEVIPILKDFSYARSTITALWPQSRKTNPNVKAFVRHLDSVFTKPTPWDNIINTF